ncbi:iron chelate uptake ABC transporter family permease subunit [Kribbella sp. NPDC026611]|uniref:FecCD family ABC transporter permease n=1 Tax=Kribbella sp. NPDC026611 TaxID=3154911 RepID=UPI003405F294
MPPPSAVASADPDLASVPARPRRRTRRSTLVLGLVGCLVLLCLVCLLSIAIGSKQIPLATVIDALRHYNEADTDHVIVRSLRVPRTLIGLMVGAALGLSGALMQGVTRNPLADPGILGVNGGAALFVVGGIYWLGLSTLTAYVWLAFAGAAAASVAVYLLGSLGREGATPVKLALAGAALTAMLGSLTTALLIGDVDTFDQFRFWSVGSFAGRGPDVAAQVAPFILVGIVLALLSGRVLNALSLGDDVAKSLGQRVGLARLFVAVVVVLLCGAATAAAGPIGFIGLTIPHVARLVTGPDYRWILPYSMLLAPILLLGSDVIGRVVALPGELQVGIVTAVIGAPFFIVLIRRRKLADL